MNFNTGKLIFIKTLDYKRSEIAIMCREINIQESLSIRPSELTAVRHWDLTKLNIAWGLNSQHNILQLSVRN